MHLLNKPRDRKVGLVSHWLPVGVFYTPASRRQTNQRFTIKEENKTRGNPCPLTLISSRFTASHTYPVASTGTCDTAKIWYWVSHNLFVERVWRLVVEHVRRHLRILHASASSQALKCQIVPGTSFASFTQLANDSRFPVSTLFSSGFSPH